MTLKPFAIGLIVAGALSGGGALAEDAGRAATRVTANYGVYWAGLHFGDIRVDIAVRGLDYEMKGDGEFLRPGWTDLQMERRHDERGQARQVGPATVAVHVELCRGNKHGEVRMSFSGGAVSDVSTLPKKRPNPKNIPVTQEQLRGVLDPMTGALLRLRPDLPAADLKICDETIPAFDGKLRFNLVLEPKRQTRVRKQSA